MSIRRAPLAVLGGLVGISINVMAQEVEPTGVTVLGRDRYRVVEIILASAYILYALFLATDITNCLPDCLLPFAILVICYLSAALGVLRNRLWGFVLLLIAPAAAVFVALFRLVQVYSVSGAIDIGAALFILPINLAFLVASLYPSLRRMRATHRETPPKAPGSVKNHEVRVDVRYVEYLAKLEELKTRRGMAEKTYLKLKRESV